MPQTGPNKKTANNLVSASCAAVLAVYVAGYARTQSAAERFSSQVAERRAAPREQLRDTPRITEGQPPEPDAPVAAPSPNAILSHPDRITPVEPVPTTVDAPSSA